MTKKWVNRWAVWLGVAVALAAPASQALTGWGLTAGEFSRQGDSTLRVEGYAFSIWGLLYAGLIVYALRRFVRPATELEAAVDLPLAIASLGCGLWILAAGLNLRWLTVLVITLSLAAAVTGMVRLRRTSKALTWGERLTVLWPLSLLAGWLMAAAVVNLLTVMTAEGLIPSGAAPGVAMAGIVAAGAIALGVTFATGFVSHVLPVAWGLGGVVMAERGDQPAVAYAAAGCAAVLGLFALLAARMRTRSPH